MTRQPFITHNKWANLKAMPCSKCLPNGMKKAPPKTMTGVCTLMGQDQANNEYIYECQSCHKEHRTKSAIGYR